MKFKEVIKVSRPRFWLYEAATFGLVGTVGALQGLSFFSDWRYWIFALYFLIPANILIYGINDIFDYETDKLNPKKGDGAYEALVPPERQRSLWKWILLTNIPFFFFVPHSIELILSFLAFVFCYGDQGLRFMGEEATIMLHGLSSGYEGKISEMNDYSKNLEDGQYALYEKISKHLKKHPGWLKKQMDIRKDKDWFLNAKEALELGIADHIDVPAFSVEISAEVKIIV